MYMIWGFNSRFYVETEPPQVHQILLYVYNHSPEGQWEYTGLFNSHWWHVGKENEKNPGE